MIIIIGNGSREQVIKEKLKSHNVCICKDINELSKYTDIEFIIPSMEKFLVDGSIEKLGIPFFGPSSHAAQIEGSKIFSKNFMKKNEIPTSNFKYFNNLEDSKNYFIKFFNKTKQVIKVDGLASGKGVFLPSNIDEGISQLNEIYNKDSKQCIVIEDRIEGEEVSLMGFCNGYDIELMPQIKDYKRIHDDNKGENTGGMGSIGPVYILNYLQLKDIKEHMLKVVKQLNFIGVLYAGIIVNSEGYYILEFNCRFGDPETQVALNLLETELYSIIKSCIDQKEINIKWKKETYCANVVLSHEDYPRNKLDNEIPIQIDDLDRDIKLYWGNCNNFKTTGGRVCSVSHTSSDLYYSLNKIYNNIYKIDYKNNYYRKDIGYDYLLQEYKKNNTKKLKIAILSSSRGTSLEKLIEHNLIELIVSNKKTEILQKGFDNNIKTYYIPNIDYNDLINIFEIYKIDLIYAVGFMNIIPKFFCDYYKDKLFNIHPSLLPKYSNLYSINIHKKIIQNNEKFSGCTLHKITEQVDAGQIMLQKQIKIDTNDYNILKKNIQELEKNILYDFYYFFKNQSINYKSSGVDIDKGNKFIEKIKNKDIGSFCSINKINNLLIASCTDGVGTKLELSREYNKYDNLGIDLVAMCVNDLYARGVTPKIFLDYLAVNYLDEDVLLQIIKSIKKGCEICNIKLVGGETAEMPGVYSYKGFDMAGFSVGIIEDQVYPKIDEIKAGYKLYAIESNGIHSNGFSMVRKLLKLYDYDINILLKPTKIYTECIDIIKKNKDRLLGMAHITGGGLTENIKRIIPSNLNIKIDIHIENEFKWIMEKSKSSYEDMLNTFNCGYGMVFIFDKEPIDFEFKIIGYIY